MIDLYDTEVRDVIALLKDLNERAASRMHNYGDFEREMREKFAELGFTVDVNWYRFEADGAEQDGAMPEVTITGRVDKGFTFDPDRQVHEAVANVLELPGEDGWIRTDPATVRNFLEGSGHGRRGRHRHHH